MHKMIGNLVGLNLRIVVQLINQPIHLDSLMIDGLQILPLFLFRCRNSVQNSLRIAPNGRNRRF